MSGVWIGPIPFGVAATQLAITRNYARLLEIFYIDPQAQIWHNWETAQNSLTWAGPMMIASPKVKQITVGMNWDGRLEIFYTDLNDCLYHDWQLTPPDGSNLASIQWAGPTPFLSSGKPDKAKFIAVGQNVDGRLEIFYVGTNGQLYHNWQLAPTNWQAGTSLSSWQGEISFPAEGSPKARAKYIAAARNQDGRLEIFYVGANNRLHHNWQNQPADAAAQNPLNSWAGEASFPVKGSSKNSAKQITVGMNQAGRLEIFYVGLDNHLFHNWQATLPQWQEPSTVNVWAGEDPIKTARNVSQVSVCPNEVNLLELMYIGSDGELYHNAQINCSTGLAPQPAADWEGELLLVSPGAKSLCMAQDSNNSPELFLAGSDHALYQYYESTVAILGLGGNVNQYIYSNCLPMQDVSVTIDVTEDIVCIGASGKAVGFSFQLNAYSPAHQKIAWQQYVLGLWGGGLGEPANFVGGINNWLSDGSGGQQSVVDDFFLVTPTSLPGPKLPAGYQLRIALSTDDKLNVLLARYIVIDNLGNPVANFEQPVLTANPGLDTTDLAPICAFVLNLVGPINGETALLSSGAGTITYQARRVLNAVADPPLCIVDNPYVGATDTLENANTSYTIPVNASITTITQNFRATGKLDPGPINVTTTPRPLK